MSEPFQCLGLETKDKSALKKAGILTHDQLLSHLPKRYEDRRAFESRVIAGQSVCLRGQVTDFRHKGFGGRRFSEATFVIQGREMALDGRLGLRWFNMPYIGNMVAAGMELVLYGKVKDSKNGYIIDHPEFEVIEQNGVGGIHIERIVPIYRNVQGIPQRRLREIMWAACEEIDSKTVRPFLHPQPSQDRGEHIRAVHFPSEIADTEEARREFALEEFFLLQLNVLWKKAKIKNSNGYSQGQKTSLLKEFYESLPFDLTGAQKRSVKEIHVDMKAPVPMHRLLQGDVGSGKTFVAMCAMLLAVESGNQATLMAPTQILAEQHYLTFKKWLEPLGLRILLKTGSRQEQSYNDSEGKAQIIIGTHALLFDGVTFENLGLVIIDEQHRFGVDQRKQLIEQSKRGPDVLVMTATPIPRTLTLSIYGDLDVSLIDELPAGRQKIVTAVRQSPKVSDVSKFIKEHVDKGRQVYIVYPLVEESETLKAGAVTVEFEKWAKRLSKYEVDLLHGKMPANDKERIMADFRSGKTDVLLSTTVIEVGVDVPNANIMLIYDAERFGLAQLHQLRGRVGRGEHKSYCVLITKTKDEAPLQKLEILAGTENGFELAEEDLKIRGPGEVLGTAQSGTNELQYIEFLADTKLIRQARALAESVLAQDPSLSQNQHLKPYIKEENEALQIS